MTIESSTITNIISTDDYKITRPETTINASSVNDSWLLSITARYSKDALSVVEKKMTEDDVYSGTVQNEIDKIQSEENQIASILQANTSSLYSEANDALVTTLRSSTAKSIGFVAYTGNSKINATTDTTAIKNCIVANNSTEKQLISDAIDLMVDWLDDYIANHGSKVAEGLARGDSELKQTFLLEVRKAIENFDFAVGFGSVGNDASDDFTPDSNTLGCYSFAAVDNSGNALGYDTYHLNTSRSLILNPTYFMPERPYKTLDELKTAVAAGTVTSDQIPLCFLVDDAAYNNYCKNYIASTLFHEIIHSTHIYDEAVTYFSNDAFDDDWYDKNLEGVSTEVTNYIKNLADMTLEYTDGTQVTLKFSDGLQYSDLLISHNLNGFNNAVEHGYSMMNANSAFQVLMPGYTQNTCKKELENFAITA